MTDTLTITDNRTGKKYDVPIEDGSIRAGALKKISAADGDGGLVSYDPAFVNTASCRSAVTFIDGDVGILRYRGIPIEQLAERSSYLETAYLLLFGELPTKKQFDAWKAEIASHHTVPKALQGIFSGFSKRARPMSMLISAVAALGSFEPGASNVDDPENRMLQGKKLIAKTPILGAWTYRALKGLPYLAPDPEKSFAGNFLSMMFSKRGAKYESDPVLERALEVLFILHADHEQNCSANAMRAIGSSHVDPYSAMAGAVAALYGPLHGGANEAVLRMLHDIRNVKRIPEFIDHVKHGEGRLMGFGHRVYKNYDPRARIIKQTAYEVFEVTGRNPLLDIALELEKIALEDEYFISRKLYPNVDFYSGLIYEALGLPADMFTIMFAVPRTSGWVAQWLEGMADSEQKIARPQQIYTGYGERPYVAVSKRR